MAEFNAIVTGDPLWVEIANALETATADVPSASVHHFEERGYALLRELCAEHGSGHVIATTVRYCGNDSLVFSWFCAAGIVEIVPYLEPFLDSTDAEEVTDAICGLIHFDHDRAYADLQRFIDGSHPVKLGNPSPLSWWFSAALKRVDSHRARSFLAQLNRS